MSGTDAKIQDSVILAICAIMSVVDVDAYFGGGRPSADALSQMRPKAKRPDTEAAATRGRSLQICNTGPSRIGLAFRTRPTAPAQACTQTGAATKSQNDGNRQHSMRAEPIGACETAPDVGTGAL